MSFTERKFVGNGHVKIRVFGASAGLIDVGDVEEVVLTQETSEISRPNLRGGGGKAYVKQRLDAVNLRMKFIDLTAARLAMALRGDVTDVAAGAVSAGSPESHVGYHGGFIPLDYVDPSSIVVKDVTDTTTYTVDTDYTVGYNGIEILATGSIGDGDTLHISYSYAAQKVVEAFLNAAAQYEVVIDGINDAKDGEYYIITVHKWQPDYAAELAVFQSDSTGELDVPGECLPDNTQGSGLSKFVQIKQTEAQ